MFNRVRVRQNYSRLFSLKIHQVLLVCVWLIIGLDVSQGAVPPSDTFEKIMLIDADSGEELMQLYEGDTIIDMQALGASRLNIQASMKADATKIHIMRFVLNGKKKEDKLGPYTLHKRAWKIKEAGTYSLLIRALEINTDFGATNLIIVGQVTLNLEVINPIDPPRANYQAQIDSLELIDAQSGGSLGELTSGMEVNTAELGTDQINIQANLAPGSRVKKLQFIIDGKKKSTSRAAPFALSSRKPLAFTEGTHWLSVVAYGGKNSILDSLEFQFSYTNPPPPPPKTCGNLSSLACEMYKVINEIRLNNGLNPLYLLGECISRAQAVSENNADNKICVHGKLGGVVHGENIVCGSKSLTSIDQTVALWMQSPSHRANILRPEYQSTGIGLAENGSFRAWTQCFSGYPGDIE